MGKVTGFLTGWLTDFADAVTGLFPFGALGLAFTIGMIVGAILGKVCVGALLVLAGVLRFGTKVPDAHENVSGPDASPPVKKKKRTLF